MKYIKLLLFVSLTGIANTLAQQKVSIVIPSYNNEEYCKENILSALDQNWSEENLEIIFINDCSTDNTLKIVSETCRKHPKGHLAIIIDNEQRKGALENLYYAIHNINDSHVVILLDGDDFLPHPDVVKRVAKEYDNGAWMTYGQYEKWPYGGMGGACEIPQYIHKTRGYRSFAGMTHLRTFYAGLFKMIKKEDLMIDESFYEMAWDLAMLYPMVEMAGKKAVFIKDVLYLYNNVNPINDRKKNQTLQQRLNQLIRSKKPYTSLVSLPFITS